ncbi:hypothetical protein ABZV25_08165 [Micrococcus luteus]
MPEQVGVGSDPHLDAVQRHGLSDRVGEPAVGQDDKSVTRVLQRQEFPRAVAKWVSAVSGEAPKTWHHSAQPLHVPGIGDPLQSGDCCLELVGSGLELEQWVVEWERNCADKPPAPAQ